MLSGGEQQQLGFAQVLMRPSDIIIMDEPTLALDDVIQTRLRYCSAKERLARPSSMPHVAIWQALLRPRKLAQGEACLESPLPSNALPSLRE